MIRRTWYCPPLSLTIPIAVSIIGAKDVGPMEKNIKNTLLVQKEKLCWNIEQQ